MSYIAEDKRAEELARRASEGIAKLGYGRLMTEEEIERSRSKVRRSAKRSAFLESILSCARSIVFTPLSIAFHAVSFVSRGIGWVSAFGMLIGGYHIYQGIASVIHGSSFSKVDSFEKAIPFLIAPFIAYGISEVTEKIYRYFEDNAF